MYNRYWFKYNYIITLVLWKQLPVTRNWKMRKIENNFSFSFNWTQFWNNWTWTTHSWPNEDDQKKNDYLSLIKTPALFITSTSFFLVKLQPAKNYSSWPTQKKTNYRWLKRMRFPIIRFSATDVKKNFYKEHGNLKKSQAIFVINDRHWFALT